ncbi:MAG: hypothetical protein WDZ30_06055, partial [Cellvibrionaceae bacterium]
REPIPGGSSPASLLSRVTAANTEPLASGSRARRIENKNENQAGKQRVLPRRTGDETLGEDYFNPDVIDSPFIPG